MKNTCTMSSERSASGPPGPSFARYFPTFCLLGRGLIGASKWSWRRRRRLAQTIIVFPLACICLYGWWEHSIGSQRRAALAITKAGGDVYYDWQWRNGGALPAGAKARAPEWLVKTLGPDYFGNIVAVDLGKFGLWADDVLLSQVGRSAASNSSWWMAGALPGQAGQRFKRLQGLTRLKTLIMYQTPLSGSDLATLGKMVDLEDLVVPEIRCSDADLAHLSGLTKLKGLCFNDERITNAGLAHLAALTDLEILILRGTNVTSLEPIRAMTRLKRLIIEGSPIDDAGLKPASAFQRLGDLRLAYTSVTDQGLASIAGLPNLKTLDIEQMRIGDTGLALLCDNPRIIHLRLFFPEVTDAGLAGVADKLNAGMCQNLEIFSPKVTREGLKSLAAKLTHTQITGGGVSYPIGRTANLNRDWVNTAATMIHALYPIARPANVNRKPTVVDEEMPQ